MRRLTITGGLAAMLVLAGCAAPDIDHAVQDTNRRAAGFTHGELGLARTAQDRREREALTAQLLAKPLAMDDAVRLALANSPAVQTVVAQRWSDMASASQGGRIANPLFTFDRLRDASGLEIDRMLSFGVLDLLTLPRRQAMAANRQDQAKTQLAIDVIDQVDRVRRAWIRAVAAQQRAFYARQVEEAAQAGAELARRMQAVGNFSRLQRAREQSFYADAATQVALSQQAAVAAREELVRRLGLTDEQAAALELPERLPDLPKEPRSVASVDVAAAGQRLDVQLARQQLDVAGQAQGLKLLDTLLDVDLGGQHKAVPGATGSQSQNGYELGIRLPVFDWGSAQRAAMNAQSIAAANRYDAVVRAAASRVRECYGAYRTAYDIARHYRDEVVPLRQTISDENVLRYNGMLIGVFELLADARDQVATVSAAIDAQQQFWIADAALSAALIGAPDRAAPSGAPADIAAH